MILAFFSYFWLFCADFLDFVDVFGFCRFLAFLAFYWLVQPDVGWRGFMQQMGLDRVDGRRWRDGKAGKEHEVGMLVRSTLAHVGMGVKRACGG